MTPGILKYWKGIALKKTSSVNAVLNQPITILKTFVSALLKILPKIVTTSIKTHLNREYSYYHRAIKARLGR